MPRKESEAQRVAREDREASLTFRARRYSRYANHRENFKDNEVPLTKPAVQALPAAVPGVVEVPGAAAAVAAA